MTHPIAQLIVANAASTARTANFLAHTVIVVSAVVLLAFLTGYVRYVLAAETVG